MTLVQINFYEFLTDVFKGKYGKLCILEDTELIQWLKILFIIERNLMLTAYING